MPPSSSVGGAAAAGAGRRVIVFMDEDQLEVRHPGHDELLQQSGGAGSDDRVVLLDQSVGEPVGVVLAQRPAVHAVEAAVGAQPVPVSGDRHLGHPRQVRARPERVVRLLAALGGKRCEGRFGRRPARGEPVSGPPEVGVPSQKIWFEPRAVSCGDQID